MFKLFKTTLFSFSIILTISGCSKNSAFNYFQVNSIQERAYANFQSKNVVNSENKTEIVISAIYLNQVLPLEYNSGESFLIALYKDDSIAVKRGAFELNSNKVSDIKSVDDNEKLRAIMPIKSSWSHYYLVSFPTENNNTLNVTYETYRSNKVSLIFQKDEL